MENNCDECLVPFQSPVTLGIFGATLCGKTTWCKKLLEQSNDIFTDGVHKILYCYGMYQPLFEELDSNLNNLTLYSGLPTQEMIENFCLDRKHNIIVLDDLQQEMSSNPIMEKLFTQLAHHLNISMVFMGNNLFQKKLFKNYYSKSSCNNII